MINNFESRPSKILSYLLTRALSVSCAFAMAGCLSDDDRKPAQRIEDSQLFAAPFLINHICTKLKICDGTIEESQCQEEMLNNKNIDEEIGLEIGEYSNFAELTQSESFGEILANSDRAFECVISISFISCGHAVMEEMIDDGQVENLELIFVPATTNCSLIF